MKTWIKRKCVDYDCERKSVAECNLGNTAVERLWMGECCIGFMWVVRQIALQELYTTTQSSMAQC